MVLESPHVEGRLPETWCRKHNHSIFTWQGFFQRLINVLNRAIDRSKALLWQVKVGRHLE